MRWFIKAALSFLIGTSAMVALAGEQKAKNFRGNEGVLPKVRMAKRLSWIDNRDPKKPMTVYISPRATGMDLGSFGLINKETEYLEKSFIDRRSWDFESFKVLVWRDSDLNLMVDIELGDNDWTWVNRRPDGGYVNEGGNWIRIHAFLRDGKPITSKDRDGKPTQNIVPEDLRGHPIWETSLSSTTTEVDGGINFLKESVCWVDPRFVHTDGESQPWIDGWCPVRDAPFLINSAESGAVKVIMGSRADWCDLDFSNCTYTWTTERQPEKQMKLRESTDLEAPQASRQAVNFLRVVETFPKDVPVELQQASTNPSPYRASK